MFVQSLFLSFSPRFLFPLPIARVCMKIRASEVLLFYSFQTLGYLVRIRYETDVMEYVLCERERNAEN